MIRKLSIFFLWYALTFPVCRPISAEETAIARLGIEMVQIPAGSFKIGSNNGRENEKPVHTVTLNAFQISATEITQEQYETITGKNLYRFKDTEKLPVENVTWYDAVLFCNKLSEAAGLDTCYDPVTWECDFTKNGFKLPTEAEWEYACKAGTTTVYYSGDTTGDLDTAGWYVGNSGGRTHPVGQKKPNAWGLYDMHGNVWEWCHDWLGEYNKANVSNPTGSTAGKYRVLRGGGWSVWGPRSTGCQSSIRGYGLPGKSTSVIGIRVARRMSSTGK